MYNIKQITDQTPPNENILNLKDIEVAGISMRIEYNDYTLEGKAVKLGFCCEPKFIGYPIYLTFKEGEEEPKISSFEIGKTGMFEFQPEIYYDINNDTEEHTATVHCIAASIPADCKFVLDYWTKTD